MTEFNEIGEGFEIIKKQKGKTTAWEQERNPIKNF